MKSLVLPATQERSRQLMHKLAANPSYKPDAFYNALALEIIAAQIECCARAGQQTKSLQLTAEFLMRGTGAFLESTTTKPAKRNAPTYIDECIVAFNRSPYKSHVKMRAGRIVGLTEEGQETLVKRIQDLQKDLRHISLRNKRKSRFKSRPSAKPFNKKGPSYMVCIL